MIKNIIKLIRVKQWVKNAFVLAPLLFSLKFLNIEANIQALIAFFAFSFTASIVYVVNDILDRKKDTLHPVKKKRPIASGAISIQMGGVIVAALVALDFVCLLHLPFKATLSIMIYVLINIFYSFKLKHVVLVDVFIIAIGFILRVYTGAYAINVPVSSYIFMTTLFLSLFLGFTKRKMELAHSGTTTRSVLENYSDNMVSQYIIISVALTIMCYALYTLEPSTIDRFATNRLIYSVIFVIYGMFRYLYILDKYENVEDPTENVLKDKGLISICLIYMLYIMAIFTNII